MDNELHLAVIQLGLIAIGVQICIMIAFLLPGPPRWATKDKLYKSSLLTGFIVGFCWTIFTAEGGVPSLLSAVTVISISMVFFTVLAAGWLRVLEFIGRSLE